MKYLLHQVAEGMTMSFFLNPNLGWAAGSGGYVYKTTDGGAHWNEQLFLNNAYIRILNS